MQCPIALALVLCLSINQSLTQPKRYVSTKKLGGGGGGGGLKDMPPDAVRSLLRPFWAQNAVPFEEV